MADLACDVHYRTTPSFHGQLGHRADEWGVSRNEVARRLAALANFELTIDDHARVVELSATMGCSFVSAATAISALGNGKSFPPSADGAPSPPAGGSSSTTEGTA